MCGITAAVGLSGAAQMVYQALTVLQNRGYDSAGLASIGPSSSSPPHPSSSTAPTPAPLICSRHANRAGRSGLEQLREDLGQHEGHRIAIGHTRWATHGGITDANAHPHLDMCGEIAVVHNGIIENYFPLKQRLQACGVQFSSQTDTEVIPQLIRYYLQHPLPGHETTDQVTAYLNAIHTAVEQLEGTWGLVIMARATPDTLYVCKKGSPLLIGYENQYALVSSEPSGFINHIKQYFSLPDHKILALTVGGKEDGGLQIRDKELTIKDPAQKFAMVTNTSATSLLVQTTPAPYVHWMFKEIMEQAESTQRGLNYGGRLRGEDEVQLGGLAQHQRELLSLEDLLITGCGTSWHAGLLGAHYLQALGGFRTVQVKEASEFTLADLPRPPVLTTVVSGSLPPSPHIIVPIAASLPNPPNVSNNLNVLSASSGGSETSGSLAFPSLSPPPSGAKIGLLALSQSGETKDLHRVIEAVRLNARDTNSDRITIFSVVNVVDSLIAREALCGVYLNAGREVAVASTKSFTSQVMVLLQIAVWFAQGRGIHRAERAKIVRSLRESRYLTMNVLHDFSHSILLQELVQRLQGVSKIFLLGRGPGLAVALEGALKIKEVAYLHAEGYPGGALKHGPFALIESGTPIIILSYEDENATRQDTAAIETRARGAYTIAITSRRNINHSLYDVVLTIPHDPILSPLLSIIPLQFLAYYLATAQGHNPDQPRNLAKVVTVDG